MSILIWIPWMLTPIVLGVGLCFRHATEHPGGRVDRALTRIWP